MKTICIFNPEHDLCLSNGSRNFMPPASALLFARKSAYLMRVLYPSAECMSVEDFRVPDEMYQIIPWGWNLALKYQLSKLGVSADILPTDEQIDEIRSLQHRTTTLPIRSDVIPCKRLEDIENGLDSYGSVVLKSPLSGSGRGLRWINNQMVDNDRYWIDRQLRQHNCVMLEPRREVVCDFAFEYSLYEGELIFIGYSLFDTHNGVYRGNVMWSDEAIESHLVQYIGEELYKKKKVIEEYLKSFANRYSGPLGVDLMICRSGEEYQIHVAEINFRHTMGLVAHEVFRQKKNTSDTWAPEVK